METKEKKTKTTKIAVIRIAGTQLKVEEGKVYEISKVEGNKGDEVVCEDVLLVAEGDKVQVGKPMVKGAKVTYVIDSQKKGEKIDVFKYKAKARYRRRAGIRPLITQIAIKSIVA